MYSWEIVEFLKKRNYLVGGKDLEKVISLIENPQLTRITFSADNNGYKMWDDEGCCFEFTAMEYQENEEKGMSRILQK